MRYVSGAEAHPEPVLKPCPTCGLAAADARILLYSRGRYLPVAVRDITALVATHKYVEVFTAQGSMGLASLTLLDMEKLYPKDWVRVHRRALIRLSEIREVRPIGKGRWPAMGVLVAGCPGPIPVARRRIMSFYSEMHRVMPMNSRREKRSTEPAALRA